MKPSMEHKDSTERCGFLRALLPLFTQEINCKTVRKCTKHAIVGQKLKIPDEEDYRINFSRAHVPPNLPGGLTSLALRRYQLRRCCRWSQVGRSVVRRRVHERHDGQRQIRRSRLHTSYDRRYQRDNGQSPGTTTFDFCYSFHACSFFLSYLGWHTLPSHASAEACLTNGQCATPGKVLV